MWNKKIPIKNPSGMFNKTDFFDFLGEEFFLRIYSYGIMYLTSGTIPHIGSLPVP